MYLAIDFIKRKYLEIGQKELKQLIIITIHNKLDQVLYKPLVLIVFKYLFKILINTPGVTKFKGNPIDSYKDKNKYEQSGITKGNVMQT